MRGEYQGLSSSTADGDNKRFTQESNSSQIPTHLTHHTQSLNKEKMEAEMSDLSIIKQLEKEIGRDLEKRAASPP